uniref:Uncharacterized protein n=1 Tax=Musa acuminata subsp. malaccensis TaxID=214687 RepID=A0A804IFT1_MUSAM|nr:PREDICTED: uncharacterized protein LOC103979560 [Musa acuminata subsp. malaccensis]
MMKRESWRKSAGSLAGKEARRNRKNSLDPDDFRDVFGGPPKSVLLRRFAGDLSAYRRTRPSPLSDEVLQPSAGTRRTSVRTETGFYDDIFGSHGDLRSARGSRSKSSESPSILSSEHVSPSIRGESTPADVVLSSSLAYKLRPIAAPRCHKSSSPLSANSREDHSNRSSITMQRPSRSFCNLFAQQSCFSYRETSNLEASFRGRHEKPLRCDSSATESPASGMSSVIFDHPLLAEAEAEAEAEDVMMEEEAAECSFSIEVGGHDMQESIDEAIAWAKEKFWN